MSKPNHISAIRIPQKENMESLVRTTDTFELYMMLITFPQAIVFVQMTRMPFAETKI
jgi:hypothetical protein